MQEDEELFVQIIKDSNKKLMVLKLLCNFFNHPDLIGALIRTKIIHNLFENNRSLDINKLELFHIQYTVSLVELFQKLKKSKEQNYLLVSDEIYINDDFICKLESEIGEIKFSEQMKVHARNMSQKIACLYKMLASDKEDVFSWDEIVDFSKSIQSEYYREITPEQYEQITCFNKYIYQNSVAKFEKKLLGRLNILNFRVKFLCGLICNNEIIEIYEFIDSNDKFIFINNNKSFIFLNEIGAKGIDMSKNNSAKHQVIHQLKTKNTVLKEQLGTLKTSLPKNIQEVLKNYLEKILSVDFLDELQNVDEQTNILKAMLNININSK
jgi:hypothetical protein